MDTKYLINNKFTLHQNYYEIKFFILNSKSKMFFLDIFPLLLLGDKAASWSYLPYNRKISAQIVNQLFLLTNKHSVGSKKPLSNQFPTMDVIGYTTSKQMLS